MRRGPVDASVFSPFLVLTVFAAEPAGAAPHVAQATFYASPTGVGTDC